MRPKTDLAQDQVAIAQPAVDLAQAAARIDDLLGRVRNGDAAVEEARRLIDDWRYEAGREFLAVRKQFPARGPSAKGWGEFVAARGISLDTAQRYMQLAELAQARPEAVRGKTIMDVYREHGLALPPPTERFPQGLPPAAENYPVKIEEAIDASTKWTKEPPTQGRGAGVAEAGPAPVPGGSQDRGGDGDGVPLVAPAGPAGREEPAVSKGYAPLFDDGPGAELAGLPRQTAPAPSPPPVPPFGVGQTLATSLGDLYLFERCEVQAHNQGDRLRLWVRPFAKPAKGVSDLPLAESWGPGEALLQGGVRVLRVHPDQAIELGKMAPADQGEAVRALFEEEGGEGDSEAPEVVPVSQGAMLPGRESPLLATLRATITTLLRDRPDRAVEVATLLRQLADEADPDHRTETARQEQADRDLAEILDLRRRVAELESPHDPPAATQTVLDAERDGYRRGKEEAEAAKAGALNKAAQLGYKQGQDELLQILADRLEVPVGGAPEELREDVMQAIELHKRGSCGTCELREAELQQALGRPGMPWRLLVTQVQRLRGEPAESRADEPGRAACDAHATPDPIEAARRLGVEHAERRRRPWASKGEEFDKLMREIGATEESEIRRTEAWVIYKEAFDASKAARKGA